MCDQQSLRPACAYAQSDQSLCLSLEYSMIVKLLTERHLEFLSLKGGCTGSSESTLIKMSNCWKSHALAHLLARSFSVPLFHKIHCGAVSVGKDMYLTPCSKIILLAQYGPRREKTCLRGFRQSEFQISLLSYRVKPEN